MPDTAPDITVTVDPASQVALIESKDLNWAMKVNVKIAVMPDEIDGLIEQLKQAKRRLG